MKNWIIEEEPAAIKKKYNLEGKFCFFFNFDYLSGYNRKNPEAILSSLAQEFPDEKQIVLVAKTNNSHRFEEKKTRFLGKVKALGLTERVIVIEDPLSRNGFMTLLNAMDCYISLHRGEGLGLGILEALALNKPVIATNYGGNTEYMNNPLAFGVPYSLIPANDDYGPYANVKQWAEPELESRTKIHAGSIPYFNGVKCRRIEDEQRHRHSARDLQRRFLSARATGFPPGPDLPWVAAAGT